ncbi:MAG: hypothetical protein QM780_00065 [Hyphomicrobium sp.]|uniref:hypothetical protein n=1 Tax=Hyphomicrobium sp. TaxID=82 RepID=UPI0039E32E30
MAADFGGPRAATGRYLVPGADVTIEAGVRVIGPIPFDPAWVVDEKTEIPGGVVYRGAAFYRVPSARAPKAIHKAKPESPAKQDEE